MTTKSKSEEATLVIRKSAW